MKTLTLLCLLTTTALFGEDITTRDGTVYKNATITTTTAAYVTVLHDDGSARVMLGNLPEELQKKYGFDPQRATQQMAVEGAAAQQRAAAKQREAILNQRKERLDKLAETKIASVMQILDEGSLVQEITYTPEYSTYTAEVDLPRRTLDPPSKSVNVRKTVQTGEKKRIGATFYLKGWSATRVDQRYEGPMWKVGEYTYKTLLGETRAIDAYTVSRAEAELFYLGSPPK